MQTETEIPVTGRVPRITFVTGPRGAGKTRWLQGQIRDRLLEKPGKRFAVLLAEEGRTRMEGFCRATPGVSVERLLLPCACCAALADLPGRLRALEASVGPDWFFAEVPAIAAAGLLSEFDRVLGWPRELVVCLDRAWATASEEDSRSPFQVALLELADMVVQDYSGSERLRAAPGAGLKSPHDPA